ncbi:MAG: hypothetical protein ABI556_10790, partial [Gemmatimonadales bacterium]
KSQAVRTSGVVGIRWIFDHGANSSSDSVSRSRSRKKALRNRGTAVCKRRLGWRRRFHLARRVLVRSRGDATVDPTRDLLIDEALVQVILGDKDETLKLLKTYLVANPEHRAGMAVTQSWSWRDLKGDPRYKELVGS